ncbi:MAG: hypothetical protein PF486_06130 [Prolixibacteraceae bacterium]|jgi:phage gp46-like protein|nr:hypothetical protein [Prolixibacteraceae bacterium]
MDKDILIIESGSGGDIVIEDNDIKTTRMLNNQVYLALFGGNFKSDVGEQNFDYWANDSLGNEHKFSSEFERTLTEVAFNTSGIRIIEGAIKKDLEYLKKYVKIEVDASILRKDLLSLYIRLISPNNVEEKIRVVWNNEVKQVVSWQY